MSTHNNPRSLGLVLAGYARQSVADFEVLIADDGSREETRVLLDGARARFPRPLVHVWQAHKGYYGKMAIMNRAITHARAEYLILADGDVIPRHDFVAAHLSMRRPAAFVAGGDFRLSDAATEALSLDDIATGRAFEYRFLRSIGQEATRRRIKLLPRSALTRMLDVVNFSPARWSGSNTGAWKADLVRANGFEEMCRAPGKDDTELGQRLRNAGVRGVHARYNTICLHLYHGMGNYSTPGKQRNIELLRETKLQRLTRARLGIAQIVQGDHITNG